MVPNLDYFLTLDTILKNSSRLARKQKQQHYLDIAMPRRQPRRKGTFKKQSLVSPPPSVPDYEDISLAQEVPYLDSEESNQGSDKEVTDDVKQERSEDDDEEDEQPWIATSRKRKEIFQRTQAHLQPLAKGTPTTSRISASAAMPPAPKKARYFVKPSGKVPGSSGGSSSSSKSPKVRIDFDARKEELAESDNIAFIDPLVETLLEVFHDVAREVRKGDLNKTGPTFLWGLVPAFVKAIEDTPWGYWYNRRRGGESMGEHDYSMWVQWTWGEQPAELSAAQVSFRQACITKVALLFEDQARTFLNNPDIRVAWSTSFGSNVPQERRAKW
jgi:hypothetical protein